MKEERGRSRVGEQRGRRKEEGREKKNVRPSLQNVGGGVVTVKGREKIAQGSERMLWRLSSGERGRPGATCMSGCDLHCSQVCECPPIL